MSEWEGGFEEGGKMPAKGVQPEYQFRPAVEADEAMAAEWIEADDDHRGRVGAPFWTEKGPGIETRILYRKQTQPLFFFRLERTVRIHIQFASPSAGVSKAELSRALESGIAWLSMALGAGAIHELVFESTTKLLRRFCIGRLKFEPEPDTLKRRLVRLPPRP